MRRRSCLSIEDLTKHGCTDYSTSARFRWVQDGIEDRGEPEGQEIDGSTSYKNDQNEKQPINVQTRGWSGHIRSTYLFPQLDPCRQPDLRFKPCDKVYRRVDDR